MRPQRYEDREESRDELFQRLFGDLYELYIAGHITHYKYTRIRDMLQELATRAEE
jgi:hypothetical protein